MGGPRSGRIGCGGCYRSARFLPIHTAGHAESPGSPTDGVNDGCPERDWAHSMTRGTASRHGLVTSWHPEPVCIHHSGHEFIASSEMAGIFLRHAQQLIDDRDTQLVPLLHRDGVDLLLVSAETPLSVHDARGDATTAGFHRRGPMPIANRPISATA
jgi:hypothetical protein